MVSSVSHTHTQPHSSRSHPHTQPHSSRSRPNLGPPPSALSPGIATPTFRRAHSNSHPPLPAITASSYYPAPAQMADKDAKDREADSKKKNRVLLVLMRRLGHSKTFGENVIFMLNRTGEYERWWLGQGVPRLSRFGLRIRLINSPGEQHRQHVGRALHPVVDTQDSIPLVHDSRDAGILLHQRLEGSARRLYQGVGGSSRRESLGESPVRCNHFIRLEVGRLTLARSFDIPTFESSTRCSQTPNSDHNRTSDHRSVWSYSA
jgi:hypothetical protein